MRRSMESKTHPSLRDTALKRGHTPTLRVTPLKRGIMKKRFFTLVSVMVFRFRGMRMKSYTYLVERCPFGTTPLKRGISGDQVPS
jgi:hypothetical protein